MTDYAGPGEARRHLALQADAERAAAAAGRRFLRRWLLGMGVAYAGWLLFLAAERRWLQLDGGIRVAITAIGVGTIIALALWPSMAAPVRARLGFRERLVLVAGLFVFFAIPSGLVEDYPVVAPVGAVLSFGYTVLVAWWVTRDR